MRTDILKVLELLPVWQLRQPLAHSVDMPVAPAPLEKPVATQPKPSSDVAASSPLYYANEAGDLWLIDAAEARSQPEMQLLHNIAAAMRLKKQQNSFAGSIAANITQQSPAVVLIVGEPLAQALLNSPAGLDQLRGEVHALANTKVVVTYALTQILGQAEIKAAVWQDCCLAQATLLENSD